MSEKTHRNSRISDKDQRLNGEKINGVKLAL